MDDPIILQYVGFETKGGVREYAFCPSGRDGESSNYFVTISAKASSKAFTEHRARYQDAPAICSIRLPRGLSTQTSHPPSTTFSVTNDELAHYQDAQKPRVKGARSAEDENF